MTLPVKLEHKRKGHDSQGTLELRDVLYVPGAVCNILGMRPGQKFQFTTQAGDKLGELVKQETGALMDLLDVFGPFCRLRLSGQSPRQTSLGSIDLRRLCSIRANWPGKEREKWEHLKARMVEDESERRACISAQSSKPPYTLDEKEWLLDHYGDENGFLDVYGYSTNDHEGMADSRRVLRAIIEDFKKGWVQLGLHLGSSDDSGLNLTDADQEGDDQIYGEDYDSDKDSMSSFMREMEEDPGSHAADYHFSAAQLD